MKSTEDIETLLKRYLDGKATQEEVKQLLDWNNAHPGMDWYPHLEGVFRGSAPDATFTKEKWEPVLTSILQQRNKKVTHLRVFKRWQLAAAACLLMAVGASLWWFARHPNAGQTANIQTNDIPAPTRSRATITLADGRIVDLDSAGNGQLARQGTIKLVKQANGQIAYQTSGGQITGELQYNTLSNPRGSKIVDMQLSDGSRVWLNAGSSVTFPVAFVGNERSVELKGEGYFEVKKSDVGKFIVLSNGVRTEVLGTHFNVNANSGDRVVKVTLLEGSVRTGNSDGSVVIKPGQQAIAGKEHVVVKTSLDLNQVMAWKNGMFNFNQLGIDEVMSQIENWYDVKVEYRSAKPGIRLFGEMGRDLSLQEVLQSLDDVGIRCRLEGKTVIIY
ncbi:FecR family protein [Chitinophaga lutea]